MNRTLLRAHERHRLENISQRFSVFCNVIYMCFSRGGFLLLRRFFLFLLAFCFCTSKCVALVLRRQRGGMDRGRCGKQRLGGTPYPLHPLCFLAVAAKAATDEPASALYARSILLPLSTLKTSTTHKTTYILRWWCTMVVPALPIGSLTTINRVLGVPGYRVESSCCSKNEYITQQVCACPMPRRNEKRW